MKDVKVKGVSFNPVSVTKHPEDEYVKHNTGRYMKDKAIEEPFLREVHKACTAAMPADTGKVAKANPAK